MKNVPRIFYSIISYLVTFYNLHNQHNIECFRMPSVWKPCERNEVNFDDFVADLQEML